MLTLRASPDVDFRKLSPEAPAKEEVRAKKSFQMLTLAAAKRELEPVRKYLDIDCLCFFNGTRWKTVKN